MAEEKLDKILEALEKLQDEISIIKDSLSSEKIEVLKTQDSSKKIRGESFMEFFKRYKPKKDTDKTLVIMKFLESNKGIDNITTKNIAEGFKEVREKTPKNVADKIQSLHKKGMVMPGEIVENLKGWIITSSGLDYLEELENE